MNSPEDLVAGGVEPDEAGPTGPDLELDLRNTALRLEPGEQVRAAADAVLRAGLRARLELGFLWNRYHRVRLLVTDRRLIEVVQPFGGRAPGSRIRAWRWQELGSARMIRRNLVLTPSAGRRVRWRVLDGRDAAKIESALAGMHAEVGGQQPAGAETHSPVMCPRCMTELPADPARCASCGTDFVSPRAAGWLAAAIPGGGHLATSHTVVGTARAVLELVAITAMWARFTGDRIVFDVPALALVMLGAVAAIKLEAALTARAFSRLWVPWSRRARRLWITAAVLAVAASVTAAAYFITMAWSTGRAGLRDIEFHSADHLGWEAQYEPAAQQDLNSPTLRSTWTHQDYWVVEVRAEALAPMQSPEQWTEQENARRSRDGLASGEPVHLGVVHGIGFVTPDSSSDGEIVRLEIAIFNRDYRAVHTLRCDVFAAQAETARALLERLLRRAHWTRAAGPCTPRWGPQ